MRKRISDEELNKLSLDEILDIISEFVDNREKHERESRKQFDELVKLFHESSKQAETFVELYYREREKCLLYERVFDKLSKKIQI